MQTLRAVLVLLENPLLLSPARYHIVLQQVATLMLKLPEAAWTTLGGWYGHLPPQFLFRAVQVRVLPMLAPRVQHMLTQLPVLRPDVVRSSRHL